MEQYALKHFHIDDVDFFFFAYSVLCYEIYCVLFNHLSIGGHLGGFQSLTNGISVAIYILICLLVYINGFLSVLLN